MTIYRYFPLKYIKQLLEKQVLFFSNVLNWEDPYENFLFKQNVVTETGTPFRMNRSCPVYFGQCWTTLSESDAMWRIYSVKMNDLKLDVKKLNDVAIKIKVESESLENCIRDKFHFLKGYEVKCGSVNYTESEEILDAVKHAYHMEFSNIQSMFLSSLFIKREAFKHEHEYRFVVQIPRNDQRSKGIGIEIPFDTANIYEFVVDPRISDSLYEQIKISLHRLGIDYRRIAKSKLYEPIKKYMINVDEHGLILKKQLSNWG